MSTDTAKTNSKYGMASFAVKNMSLMATLGGDVEATSPVKDEGLRTLMDSLKPTFQSPKMVRDQRNARKAFMYESLKERQSEMLTGKVADLVENGQIYCSPEDECGVEAIPPPEI